MTSPSTLKDSTFGVFDLLSSKRLSVFQVSVRFPFSRAIFLENYSRFKFSLRLLTCLRTYRYETIKIEEFFLMAMILSLPLVRARALYSLVNHGEYLSETLSSVSGACFSITNESRYGHLLTASLISLLKLTILSQSIWPRSDRKLLLFKFF